MSPPDLIMIDGRPYSWRQLCERRRQQLREWKASRPQQPALFQLKEDCRPRIERSAAGRFAEPTLLDWRNR